jgi:polyhydroxyalkanoate synthesis regulator protein
MSKQNIALFERAMQMFSPFGPGQGGQAPGQGGPGKAGAGNAAPGAPAAQPPFRPAQPAPAQGQPGGATIDTLLQRLNDLQRQIDGLTGGKR